MLEVAGSDARVEGAVVAARIGATELGPSSPFLPLAMGGAGGLLAAGTPVERLLAWYGAVERSAEATVGLSGRTPARLLDAPKALPPASAPMLEGMTLPPVPPFSETSTDFWRSVSWWR